METIYKDKKQVLKLARIENTVENWEKIYTENEKPIIYFYKRVFELKYNDKTGFKLVENKELKKPKYDKMPYTLRGRWHVFNGYYLNK